MIEVLIFVVGFITGGVTGGLIYRNNAEEWRDYSERLEEQFDELVDQSNTEINELRGELEILMKKFNKKK